MGDLKAGIDITKQNEFIKRSYENKKNMHIVLQKIFVMEAVFMKDFYLRHLTFPVN
jgi:hypothetical protein